jgi:hypothetical protein
MSDHIAEMPVQSSRWQPGRAGTAALAFGWVLWSGCSPDREAPEGFDPMGSLRTPVPLVLASDGQPVEGSGTLFFAFGGVQGFQSSAKFVDESSTVWYWSKEEPEFTGDISWNFPWAGRFEFGIPESSRRAFRPIDQRGERCKDECSLRFYYTEQEFNGRDGQISDWERDRGDLRMWDEAPELWRYAEFEYRFSDRVDVSFVESFDDETGRGVLQLGLVTIDLSGDGMVVEMRAHPFDVFDWNHPAITSPVPDVSEFPEETDAVWEPK